MKWNLWEQTGNCIYFSSLPTLVPWMMGRKNCALTMELHDPGFKEAKWATLVEARGKMGLGATAPQQQGEPEDRQQCVWAATMSGMYQPSKNTKISSALIWPPKSCIIFSTGYLEPETKPEWVFWEMSFCLGTLAQYKSSDLVNLNVSI